MNQLPIGRIMSIILMISMYLTAQAQGVRIKGNVKDSSDKPLPRASVMIKETGQGTTADEKGEFIITTKHALPLTLVISNTGYANEEITVNSTEAELNVLLRAKSDLGEVIVTSGSRLPERYIESPVSIERMGTAAVRNAAAPNYYSGIANLKGVDLTTSSLTFQTISTRGFNGSGNLRFNQLIEGMDNQAPGLSFSVGNIIGLTELDVDNVELLPGASSALYGSGGMNGTLLMTGKNPFKYQGLSVQYKQGINHISDYRHAAAPVFDGEIRYAKAFKNKSGRDKFAFKIAGKYFNAQDWQADDSSNLLRNNVYSTLKPGNRTSDPNYDGVNVFGDEASASMQAFAREIRARVESSLGPLAPPFNTYLNGLIANPTYQKASQVAAALRDNPIWGPIYPAVSPYLQFLLPTATITTTTNPYGQTFGNQLVSRQGYAEKSLVDYNAYNFKITGGLYYKITNDIEASVQAYFGRGTTVYTGSDRYSLKNLQVGQYKFELKSTNWFLRGYTTQENSGDSYTATTAAVAINAAWKPNATWFQQYTGTYGAARLGLLPGSTDIALNNTQAHQQARAVAEAGRYLPGTQDFKNAFDKAVNTSISQGGAKFADKTSLYHAEGQYNFSSLVKVVDVLAGASYRVYHLNSGGTIFYEPDGPFNVSEYGTYLQLQKKLLKDVLKLTASGRYDKNQNFKGRFTPRFSALVKVAKDNNIRLSYQVAYRFPSTQDQYINLPTPSSRLIGGLDIFKTLYGFNINPAYTAESIGAYRAASIGDSALLRVAPFIPIKPETVNSYEIGYRGLVTKQLLIDAYGYISRYKNFIGRVAVGRGQSMDNNKKYELYSPFTTTNYSFAVNSPQTIQASGWGFSAEYRFQKRYSATANISGDYLQNVPAGFISFFNTPKVRYNLGLSSVAGGKSIGFNVVYRWQDKVNWEGTFGSAQIPAFGTLDAQVSYLFPKVKTLVKLGGTNILNDYYRSAFGNPYVGALLYLSLGYNVF
jgi:outer membrane receptor protein involved in Fe transport